MSSVICSRTEPFADWLDVTFSPDLSELKDCLFHWLDVLCFPVKFTDDKGRVFWSVGDGVLVYESKPRFQRVSASGSVLSHLRSIGSFRDYCNFLGGFDHKITRLDAAVDVFRDAPASLRELEARYPDDVFHFGRKALKVTRMYSKRDSDHLETGTWYAGHRSSARVTARVYDKQDEALEKRNEKLPPTTRYELTFRKDYGVSFWDVLMPRDLFYSHAHTTLLPCDGSYDTWESRGCVPWSSRPVPSRLTLEQFERRLEASPDIDHLLDIVSCLGAPAKALLMRRFEQRLDSVLASKASSEDVA
jgi:hypothetical protein